MQVNVLPKKKGGKINKNRKKYRFKSEEYGAAVELSEKGN